MAVQEDRRSDLISYMTVAMANSSIYSPEHSLVAEYSLKAWKIMEELFIDGIFTITILGNTLLINDSALSETSPHILNFIKRVKRKGIEKIVIRKGVEVEELRGFLSSLVSSQSVASTKNISIGIVEVKYKADGVDIKNLIDENVAKIREAHEGISRLKRLDIVSLEDAVAGFISSIKREKNILNVISPVKSHSEYTYVHITNVAILTIFQAEILGFRDEILHEAGLAGLLHDSGKMMIPKEILEKKGKFTPSEWNEMKKHPVYGALYLSTLPQIPRLAVIAAFEHHMKFDGSGYPETKRFQRTQHLISQIVAIADFFDAMRTRRSYRKDVDVKEVIDILIKLSGKDFNPVLVENFIYGLRAIKAI